MLVSATDASTNSFNLFLSSVIFCNYTHHFPASMLYVKMLDLFVLFSTHYAVRHSPSSWPSSNFWSVQYLPRKVGDHSHTEGLVLGSSLTLTQSKLGHCILVPVQLLAVPFYFLQLPTLKNKRIIIIIIVIGNVYVCASTARFAVAMETRCDSPTSDRRQRQRWRRRRPGDDK